MAGNLTAQRYNATEGRQAFVGAYSSVTASGTVTLDATYGNFVKIDPDGSGRTVLLPAEVNGDWFYIENTAASSASLTVKEHTNTTTIGTLAQNKCAFFVCDGTAWHIMGILTRA
jgi:hypothetical protein